MSLLGDRYSHGHVFDFFRSLRRNPSELRVLGNGQQRKSYLYVQDCLDAMLLAIERSDENVNIFNLGTDEYCKVIESIGWITAHLGVSPKLTFTGRYSSPVCFTLLHEHVFSRVGSNCVSAGTAN